MHAGTGSTEGSYVPVQIPALEGEPIVQLECGTQFSVALSKNGRVYTWGRGEYFRLGTDSSAPIYQPHRLLSLSKVKVVQVSVGGLHCIALTDNGEVSQLLSLPYVLLRCFSYILGVTMNMDNKGMGILNQYVSLR